MKFKAEIIGRAEPVINIGLSDFYNGKSCFIEEKKSSVIRQKNTITTSSQIAKGILILNIQMYFSSPQSIRTTMPDEAIVLNFICGATAGSDAEQLNCERYLPENTHNILYTEKLNATFKIPANQEINYLSIIMSCEFYSQLINEDWSLHQKFSNNILRKKPGYLTSEYIPFNAEIQWIIHEIKECQHKGSLKKMYLEAKIKELVMQQIDANNKLHQKAPVDEKDYEKLLEAKKILDDNFTNAPTLLELSRLISLNEFKLKKGFKACFEITVKNYVTKLRMEHAKNLFKNNASNVGEVAYKCGYKDVSHFSAAFKSFYGFTPISFRKMMTYAKLHILSFELLDFIPILELM